MQRDIERERVYIYEKRLRLYFIVRLFVRYVCREIERERESVCKEIERGCVFREIESVYVER